MMGRVIYAPFDGTIEYADADKVIIKGKGTKEEVTYFINSFQRTSQATAYTQKTMVNSGDRVKKGDLLTDGSADISSMFKFGNKELVEKYIIREINKVYELQSASISRKHTEIIIRQMFSRKKIKDAGDTNFSIGDIVENTAFMEENSRIGELYGKDAEGKKAKAETVVLGITEVSLRTKSWLSAASFQNTNRVLIENAIKGGVDSLRGLKENVIIGRLIPAGTGFKDRIKAETEK